MNEEIEKLTRYYLGEAAPETVVRDAARASLDLIAQQIEEPAKTNRRQGGPYAELIVPMPSGPTHVSLKIGNLARNAINPTGWRQILAAGTLDAHSAGGLHAWTAFIISMTALISQPVPFAEACILHKAWELVGFDRIVTVPMLSQVSQEITDDYGIVKTSPLDIQTYLDNLERLGCVRPQSNGYELKERIPFSPG